MRNTKKNKQTQLTYTHMQTEKEMGEAEEQRTRTEETENYPTGSSANDILYSMGDGFSFFYLFFFDSKYAYPFHTIHT